MADLQDIDTHDYVGNLLMLHTLNTAMGEAITSKLSLTDLKQYLRLTMSIESELSQDATELLQAYYMSSRRMRSSSLQRSDVPIRMLSSL